MKQKITKDYHTDNDQIHVSTGSGSGYMKHAHWNLLLSIRDLQLFCKGIKPHRYWKLRDVKDYFGVKGNKEKVLEQLLEMFKQIEDEQDRLQKSS